MYTYMYICNAYGRAGYKLCVCASDSTYTMEVRGKCICRCYLLINKLHCILADDISEVNSCTTSFDCQPGIVISLFIIIYYSFPHTVDSVEESHNGTESKSVSEFSESESDVEKEGLQEPPNTPLNFECESEIASSSDIDEHENQTENNSNAFKDNTETSFECPMQHADYLEPLYQGASITKSGAYYCIMLYARKFKLSDKAINGLTKLLHMFCPSPNCLPKSEYMIKKFFKQFSVPYKHCTVCTICGVQCQKQCSTCVVPEPLGHLIHIPFIKHLQSIITSKFT